MAGTMGNYNAGRAHGSMKFLVVSSSGYFVRHRKFLTPKEFHNKAQGQRRSRATLGKDDNHTPKTPPGFHKDTSFLCATPLGLRKV